MIDYYKCNGTENENRRKEKKTFIHILLKLGNILFNDQIKRIIDKLVCIKMLI